MNTTRRLVRDRRVLRDRPYLPQHLDRQAAVAREPRTLGELLHWFLEGFAAETPERMHSRGVWVGRPARNEVEAAHELTGGSLLGAPRQAEQFRQLLENSPHQTAEDETGAPFYVRPMRSAIARLSGRVDPQGDRPFFARLLVQVAYGGGDWGAVMARWPMDDPVGYLLKALQSLRRVYRAAPPSPGYINWLERSDAQRAAEQGEVA